MVLAPSLTCLPQRKMLRGVKRSARDRGQEGAEYRRGRALGIQRLQRPAGRSSLVRGFSLLAATVSNAVTYPNPPPKMYSGS